MDIDEYADSINALYEIDELGTSKQHDERKSPQAERVKKTRSFNLGPIGIKVTSTNHPAVKGAAVEDFARNFIIAFISFQIFRAGRERRKLEKCRHAHRS